MIPLSAHATEQAGGAQRDLHRAATRRAPRKSRRRSRRAARSRAPPLHRRHGAKVILQILPPQQPRRRLLRALGLRRRLIAAHRLPHGGRVPAQSQPPQRGMELESRFAPRRGSMAASAARGSASLHRRHRRPPPASIRAARVPPKWVARHRADVPQEFRELAAVPANRAMHGGMRGHEGLAQRREHPRRPAPHAVMG
jgi:hypothetical protein